MTESQTRPRRAALRAGFCRCSIFAGLAGLFWFALHGGDPSLLPSALIGKTVPAVHPAAGRRAYRRRQGRAGLRVVGSWRKASRPSSMCAPRGACTARTSIRSSSSSPSSPASACSASTTRTTPASARRFLGRYGNPYSRVGADASGRIGHRLGRLWRAGDLCDHAATARSPTAMSAL